MPSALRWYFHLGMRTALTTSLLQTTIKFSACPPAQERVSTFFTTENENGRRSLYNTCPSQFLSTTVLRSSVSCETKFDHQAFRPAAFAWHIFSFRPGQNTLRAVDCISLTTLRQRLQYSRVKSRGGGPAMEEPAGAGANCCHVPNSTRDIPGEAIRRRRGESGTVLHFEIDEASSQEIDSIASDAPSILASPQGLSLYSLTAH